MFVKHKKINSPYVRTRKRKKKKSGGCSDFARREDESNIHPADLSGVFSFVLCGKRTREPRTRSVKLELLQPSPKWLRWTHWLTWIWCIKIMVDLETDLVFLALYRTPPFRLRPLSSARALNAAVRGACERRPVRRSASCPSWAWAKPLVVTATYNRKWGLRGKLGLFFQVFRPIAREKFSSLSKAPPPLPPHPTQTKPPTLKLLSSVERSSSTFNLALLILANNAVCVLLCWFTYLFIQFRSCATVKVVFLLRGTQSSRWMRTHRCKHTADSSNPQEPSFHPRSSLLPSAAAACCDVFFEIFRYWCS